MNVRLLKQRDEQECEESFNKLWTVALKSATKRLYIPPFTKEDREDVAQKVLFDFLKQPPPLAGIDYCDDDDPASCERWIWMRGWARATDRLRQRRREREVIVRNPNEGVDEAVQEAAPIAVEGLVDELVAYARLMPGRFSILEERVFREIIIERRLQREFAREYGMPIGTVGRLVIQVQGKIRRLFNGQWGLL